MGPTLPEVHYPEDIPAEKVVEALSRRFSDYFVGFGCGGQTFRRDVADASAGGDKVKIKEGAFLSSRDIDL